MGSQRAVTSTKVGEPFVRVLQECPSIGVRESSELPHVDHMRDASSVEVQFVSVSGLFVLQIIEIFASLSLPILAAQAICHCWALSLQDSFVAICVTEYFSLEVVTSLGGREQVLTMVLSSR